MIGFLMDQDTIRIEGNLEAAQRVEVKISSSLQAHAKREIRWEKGNGNVVL